MSSRRSCSSSVERQLPKLHRWVRLPSAAPKRKTRLPSCLSFWVPAAAGGLHPPGDSNARRKYPQNGYAASVRRQSRQRLRSEFRLRQGFRLRRKRLYGANAPPTRWPVGCIGQKSRKLENIDFDRPLQLVASDISLATSFFISFQNSSRAHSAAPHFRKKSRSACLLGCKRPHDGSLSLPTFCEIPPYGRYFSFRIKNIDFDRPFQNDRCKPFFDGLQRFFRYRFMGVFLPLRRNDFIHFPLYAC